MNARRAKLGLITTVVALAFAANGCGYRLVGSGGERFLPESIRSIAVLPFENRTDRPEIEQRVTEEVARELAKRAGYDVGTDASTSDAVLEGAITDYRTIPVQFTAGGRATRVESIVRIEATLREVAEDQVLWSQSGLIFKEQYDIPESGEFFDQETVALDEIASGAAGALVTSLVEGF